MTFLSKLGGLIAKGLSIWYGLSGAAGALNPSIAGVVHKIDTEISQIAQIVITVEAIGQKLGIKGPEKLTAAAPLVAQVILQSALLARHKIKDEALFAKGCGEIAGGFADILNALDDDVDVKDKT